MWLTLSLAIVLVVSIAYCPGERVRRVAGLAVPLAAVIYFSGLLWINHAIPEDGSPVPRGAYLIAFGVMAGTALWAVFVRTSEPHKHKVIFNQATIYSFLGLFAMMFYLHADFIRGEHLPSHKKPNSYGYEVQAAYRPEIPEWIYYVAKTVDKPGCINILLPVSPVNLIKWGWGGSSDVLLSRGLILNSTLIFKEYGEGYTVSKAKDTRARNEKLFGMLTSNQPLDVNLLKEMGVCHLILRTDFNDRKDFTKLPVSFYRKKLAETPGLKKIPPEGYQGVGRPWQIYQAATPPSAQEGLSREHFLFGSHYAYYAASPDPDIEAKFVKLDKYRVAKPFAWFLLGLALFVVGLVGLWAFCRVRLKPASR